MKGIEQVVNMLGAASALAFIFGAIMTIDCRQWAKNWDQAESCYFSGGSVMGIGGLGKAASSMFVAGYNTLNPSLRTKRDDDRPDSV